MGSGEHRIRLSVPESEPPPPLGGADGDDPHIGKVFGGRYRILSKLAEGAQARVYVGRHLMIKRVVAIKVLLPILASDRVIVDRFLNEGRAAGTIGHPNIVESLDMGQAPDGAPYLVMELLEGKTLAEDISLLGPFLVGRATYIASQMASAVGAANERGIVHRDLKPENVFLIERAGKPDHVKVLDFGISKFAGDKRVTTQKGQFLGTPDYMAPEQIENPGTVDERADMYAVGAILYAMLAGEAPFADVDFPKVLSIICEKEPRPIADLRPGLPIDLVAIVERAMAKKPELRYQHMAEFEEALMPFVVEPRKAWSQAMARSGAPSSSARTSSGAIPDQAPTVPKLPPLPAGLTPPPSSAAQDALTPPSPSPVVPAGATDMPRSLSRVPLPLGALALGAAALGACFVIAHAWSRPAVVTPSTEARVSEPAHSPDPPAIASDPPSAPSADPAPEAPSSAPAPTAPTAARAPPGWPTRVASAPAHATAVPASTPEPTPLPTIPAVASTAAAPSPSPTPASPASADPAPAASPAPAPVGLAPGTIEAHAVNATVRAHAGEVRSCFDRARMNNADLRGKVTVRARVNPDGSVSGAGVASSSANDARLESCIATAFRGWQFPAPAGGVPGTVTYTFVFE
jgi:serine/threonine-protein kinase